MVEHSSFHVLVNLQKLAEDALRDISIMVKDAIRCEPAQSSHASELPLNASIGIPSTPSERSGWIYLAAALAAAGYCKETIRVLDFCLLMPGTTPAPSNVSFARV
jgi:hypothetical protein